MVDFKRVYRKCALNSGVNKKAYVTLNAIKLYYIAETTYNIYTYDSATQRTCVD